MLEVGNLKTFEEDRAHFGAWVIVSAPLILGYNLSDAAITARVWPILSNTETLAISQASRVGGRDVGGCFVCLFVSHCGDFVVLLFVLLFVSYSSPSCFLACQTWAGHPGRLVKSWNPHPGPGSAKYVWASDCGGANQTGWKYTQNTLQWTDGSQTLCLDAVDGSELQMNACSGAGSQAFSMQSDGTLRQGSKCVDVYDFSGPVAQMYGCNGGCNQKFTIQNGVVRDTCTPAKCFEVRSDSPAAQGAQLQLWAKPLKNGAMAAFVITNVASGNNVVTITLADLGLSGTVAVRDIWQRKDLGTASGTFTTDSIMPHDSRMYIFTPHSA